MATFNARAETVETKPLLREKLIRGRIAARLANVPKCLIGIEAGMATHCVARELIALGHEVKQVPPVYARPFRQGHKNDFRDAPAVAEAVQRPSTRCVPVKTDDQLDLQALHRVRSRLISERITEEIEELAHGTEGCRQLTTVPGIGPIIASAMVAAIGPRDFLVRPGRLRAQPPAAMSAMQVTWRAVARARSASSPCGRSWRSCRP